VDAFKLPAGAALLPELPTAATAAGTKVHISGTYFAGYPPTNNASSISSSTSTTFTSPATPVNESTTSKADADSFKELTSGDDDSSEKLGAAEASATSSKGSAAMVSELPVIVRGADGYSSRTYSLLLVLDATHPEVKEDAAVGAAAATQSLQLQSVLGGEEVCTS
jgi:hypothetical protein